MPEDRRIDPQILKERVGKHLRTADELTRQQRFEEAIMEIERALELDPRNNYARSFLERVKLMHKRFQQKGSDQPAVTEISLEERMAIIARHLSAAEEYINQRDFKHALEEVARVYKIDPQNYYAQTYSARIDILMQEGTTEAPKPVQQQMQPQPAPAAPAPQQTETAERGSTLMYRELLKDAWLDGKITDQEEHELTAMRELFGITQTQHEQLEHDIKIEAYLEALRIVWRDNVLSDVERKTLQMMREKYNITPEELAVAESQFEKLKRSAKSLGTVLVADPDRESLISTVKLLKQRGFTVFMAQRVEDALQILNTQTPNLIIAEVLFPNSQIDGVEFLKKIRAHSTLRRIPFIFTSSIHDKKVIHASYRLGADHFIAKPIDTRLLLAMIEGKLGILL
jgi:CheY-like chemotaxis protein